MLLDLTAAFDTIDHAKLLHIIKKEIGIGIALKWFESFLVGRSQTVKICDEYLETYVIIWCGPRYGAGTNSLQDLYTIIV